MHRFENLSTILRKCKRASDIKTVTIPQQLAQTLVWTSGNGHTTEHRNRQSTESHSSAPWSRSRSSESREPCWAGSHMPRPSPTLRLGSTDYIHWKQQNVLVKHRCPQEVVCPGLHRLCVSVPLIIFTENNKMCLWNTDAPRKLYAHAFTDSTSLFHWLYSLKSIKCACETQMPPAAT